MVISPIFDVDAPKLWAVCNHKDSEGEWIDVFYHFLEQCYDTDFLYDFIVKNKEQLQSIFWIRQEMTVDRAFDQVLDELDNLQIELEKIDSQKTGYENKKLESIFKPLHDNIYSLSFKEENFMKGKALNFKNPLVRFYAISLSDGTLIITGGAIKLTQTMDGEYLDKEWQKLETLRKLLKSESIDDVVALKDYIESL